MCGIVGAVAQDASYVDAMLGKLRHRGPDHLESVMVPGTRVALGHARLSIIDLDPRSNQPFFSADRRHALVFNGEIYNYKSLKARLESAGYRFRTTSDTEVLLYWLIHSGVSGLDSLEGMFAFCFYDESTGELLLARDQIGEKPLYFASPVGNAEVQFAFASEIKSLSDIPGVDRSINQESLIDYLRFLYTPAPHTLYTGIKELPPGSYMRVCARTGKILNERQYYLLDDHIHADPGIDAGAAARFMAEELTESVEKRLVADVPVGLFLSTGLDSNAILAAARGSEVLHSMFAFTLQYEGEGDESRLAQKIASSRGLHHRAIPFLELEFHSSLDLVLRLFDQPFGNATALVSHLIAREAVRQCKVCLVGDGGDEIAIGYPRYKALLLHERLARLPTPLKRGFRQILDCLPQRGSMATRIRRAHSFAGALCEDAATACLDWVTYLNAAELQRATGSGDTATSFYRGLLSTFARFGQDPLTAAAVVDLKSFVPFNLMQSADRTSMANGLELRCPFLSPRLIHRMLSIPSSAKLGRGTKPVIRDAFRTSLPAEVLDLPKRPFNPPIRVLLGRNKDKLRDYLLGNGSKIGSLLDRSFVEEQVNAFEQGRRDNSTFLWGLATLERWLQ